MSDKAEQKLIAELNLPWRDCETAAGKGKVVDRSGFSVCNTSGGCYAEQRQKAKFITMAANNHYKLVDALDPDTLIEAAVELQDSGYESLAEALDKIAAKQIAILAEVKS